MEKDIIAIIADANDHTKQHILPAKDAAAIGCAIVES